MALRKIDTVLKCSYWCDKKDSRAFHSLGGGTRYVNNYKRMITETLRPFLPFLKAMRNGSIQRGEKCCCAYFHSGRCRSLLNPSTNGKDFLGSTVCPCKGLRSRASNSKVACHLGMLRGLEH